uniref:Uncharacterized protein n=1 Tax=Arundo donax TaxID=35708 RepID=A0A0A9CM92_ARUDO
MAWRSCASAGRCRSAAAPTPKSAAPARAGGRPSRAGASPQPAPAPGWRRRGPAPVTWWTRPPRASGAAARGWRGGVRAPSGWG